MNNTHWLKHYCEDDGTLAVALDCERCYIHIDSDKFIAADYDNKCKGKCRHPSNVTYVDFKSRRQSDPSLGQSTPERNSTMKLKNTITITTRRCIMCGQTSEVTVDADGHRRWKNGTLVQRAFPDMDIDQRELLINGTHAACFESLFTDD